MELYRIISLETFIDLLHHKRERYVRPSTWEDVFEGYLFSKIYDPIERRKIVEDIYYTICPRNYQATIENMLRSFQVVCIWSMLVNRSGKRCHVEDLLIRKAFHTDTDYKSKNRTSF